MVLEILVLDICVDYVLSPPFGNSRKDLQKSPSTTVIPSSIFFVDVLIVKYEYILEAFVQCLDAISVCYWSFIPHN